MPPLEVGLGISQLQGTERAVTEAVEKAKAGLSTKPGLAVVTTTVEHDSGAFAQALESRLPGVPVFGVTTSLGILGSTGVVADANGVVGIMLLASPDGAVSFASGSAPITTSATEATLAAARALRASRPDETPRLLLVGQSPGAEEDVLSALAGAYPGVPAYGGSAADHAISGNWSTFGSSSAHQNGVSLAALFGPIKAGGAFLSPYTVTDIQAVVTDSDGRSIRTLGNRIAAEVLGEWIGSSIAHQVKSGGVILAQTALSPLAVRRTIGSSYHFIPSHPFQITRPEGSVQVFTGVEPGDTVCLLRGSVDDLVGHLAPLVEHALATGRLTPSEVKGGILIYCAGCAGAVGEQLDRALRQHLQPRLPGVPLLGMCTFGEQGFIAGLGNVHQNLTLGLVLLG